MIPYRWLACAAWIALGLATGGPVRAQTDVAGDRAADTTGEAAGAKKAPDGPAKGPPEQGKGPGSKGPGGGGGPGGPGGGGPPPAMVRLAPVVSQELRNHLRVVGRLREVRRALVSAEEVGRFVEVGAEEGLPVVGGKTVLARVDDTWARLALESAEARVQQAAARSAESQAGVSQALRDLEHVKSLAGTAAALLKEVDDAKTKVDGAQAALAAARAEGLVAAADRSRAEVRLKRVEVLAPFDGVVVRKLVEVGQWSKEGEPVAEIVSRGTIDAVVDVPERVVNGVSVGDELEVIIEPLGLRAMGKVRQVVPMGENAARTFPVKVGLEDREGLLKPGMSVVALVPTAEREMRVAVPRDAVLRGPMGEYVWADSGGVAMRVGVEVLFGSAEHYAVRVLPGPPLRPGMNVVVEGGERVMFPGQPLIAVRAPAGVNPPRLPGVGG